MKGYYIIENNNHDLIMNVVDTNDPIPPDQQELATDIANTYLTLELLYGTGTHAFEQVYEQLFGIAKLGLQGEFVQPAMAVRALAQLKQEVTDKESGKRKNAYLKLLGIRALIGGFPLLLTGVTINFCTSIVLDVYQTTLPGNLFILVGGTMIGVWLSFAISKPTIGFSDLPILEKDRLEPALRLVFTGILSLIFGLLFARQAIVISLGGISSTQLESDWIPAFVLGVILGVNEKILGSTLVKKTAGLFDK